MIELLRFEVLTSCEDSVASASVKHTNFLDQKGGKHPKRKNRCCGIHRGVFIGNTWWAFNESIAFRDVPLRRWLPNDGDEHVHDDALNFVNNKVRGDAMLAFVIGDQERVLKVTVLRPDRDECRGGTIACNSCGLGHVIWKGL